MNLPLPTINAPSTVTTQTVAGETFAQAFPVILHVDSSGGPGGKWPSSIKVRNYNSTTTHLAPDEPQNYHAIRRDLNADSNFPLVGVAMAGVIGTMNLLFPLDAAEKAATAATASLATANAMAANDPHKAASLTAANAAVASAATALATAQGALSLDAAIATTQATLTALHAAKAAGG